MKKKPDMTSQRGTAIIVALFVTALVAAAAVAMIEHLSIDTRRTQLVLNNTQADLYAQGSIIWAQDQLVNDLKQQQPGKVIDRTPIASPVNTVNGAKIWSVIEDAQGNINLNNLTDAPYQVEFARLIQLVAPEVSAGAAKNITQAIADWITPGLNNTRFDQYYAKQNPPWRAPHRMMVSVSELQLVQGMTPALYSKLEPFIAALPVKTKININSAPIPVVMSFSPSIDLETAKAFDVFRRQSPLADLALLTKFPAIQNSPFAQGNLTISSDFFLVKTHVTIGDQQLTLHTLMMRLLEKSQPKVIIVWQSKGTL